MKTSYKIIIFVLSLLFLIAINSVIDFDNSDPIVMIIFVYIPAISIGVFLSLIALFEHLHRNKKM